MSHYPDCECERWRDDATLCPVHGTTKPTEPPARDRPLTRLIITAAAWIVAVAVLGCTIAEVAHPREFNCAIVGVECGSGQ